MDLKTLFHNPDSLTDDELKTISKKLRFQRMLPFACAGIGAVSIFLLQSVVLKRYVGYSHIMLGLAGGFGLGAHFAHS
jgi:hypothetical protein